MAVQAETLLPKDREATLAEVARKLVLDEKLPSRLPLPPTSTLMDLSPPSTLVPWPTLLVLPTTAPRFR